MKDQSTTSLQPTKRQEEKKKRNASEPLEIHWEDGEPFKLSEEYLRNFYRGKEKFKDYPFWAVNRELVGNRLIMELRGKGMYDVALSVVMTPEHVTVTCGCNSKVQQLCRHACSALMYKVRSDNKYFKQFYLPEITALAEEQQKLFSFELHSYYRKYGKVQFKPHPDHGRIFRYTNGDDGQPEQFSNPIQLVEPAIPHEREAKLVFGVPIGSYYFQYPVLLPFLTKTGTKTAKVNPYAAFEKSYLLTGEGEPTSLTLHEQATEAACRNMLRITEESDRQTKQVLLSYWAELIPNLHDSIQLLFFDGYQSSQLTTKPSAGSRKFPKLVTASVKLVFDLKEYSSWFQLKLSLFVNGKQISNPRFLGKFYSCFTTEGNDTVYFISNAQDETIIHQFRKSNFTITALSQDFPKFFNDILLPISNRYRVNLYKSENNTVFSQRALKRHTHRLKIEERDGRLFFHPTTCYSVGFTVNPMVGANLLLRERGGKVHVLTQNKNQESEFITMVSNLHPSFERQNHQSYFCLSISEIARTTWLPDSLSELYGAGVEVDINGLQEGASYFPRMFSWEMNVFNEKDGHYQTKIKGRLGSMAVSLEEMKDMAKRSKNWFNLKDGTVGVVRDTDKEQLRPLLSFNKFTDCEIGIPTSHFNTLAKYTDYITNPAIKTGIQTKRQKLIALETVQPVSKPELIQATLRPYQEAGLSWLAFLREFGWGGILADDMGLGKTLQVISILEYHYQQQPDAPASLVVVPNTLLFNWEEEFRKFAPHRRVHTHHGNERYATLKYANGLVILTTYGTLVADIDLFKQLDFSYLVLDESQSVKNRNSKRYEAAGQLKAQYRIAMTGTPIENGIADLYSQLSFVNPGFLGSFSDFKRTYKGIADGSATDETKTELQRVISPFILRRTKKQVAKELPDKSEMLLYCEMLPEQRRVYDEYRTLFRSKLSGSLENDNAGRSKFLAIEGLMKLRQICNSPYLLKDGNYPNMSAKLDELMEQVGELQAQHKILVFSAFTAMLSLLKGRLAEAGFMYAYLDGKTAGDERQEQVRFFQDNEQCRLFLLSLKAGGTGLNLTAADYVYILDPWWNPATEAQAIDRCYRIGQDKHVMAYRMICKDSIEEKILNMQASKKALADSLIQTDNSVLKALDKDELLRLFD